MILSTQMLIEKYNNYIDPKGKISREVNKQNLFKITKGKYETNRNVEPKYLSSYIYGPSYLSFEYALSFYGLIPEAVYVYTSATFNKRKTKVYTNILGTYSYQDVPIKAYPYGIIYKSENNYSYQIATPEKALCDQLYKVSPVKSVKRLKVLLFNDLRIYEDEFNKLNKKELLQLAALYNSTNLNLLIKMSKGVI